MKELKVLALAIIEKEEKGQLCPQTLEKLARIILDINLDEAMRSKNE